MHGDQGVSFYGEEYDQFLSAKRYSHFHLCDTFRNSTAPSLIPKHVDYIVQPQGLPVLSDHATPQTR
jgi:hypothetical protein